MISGNSGVGIEILGYGIITWTNAQPGTHNSNRIIGNFIGVAADAFSPLGNGSHGVLVDSEGNVIIGGTESDAANIIAYNGGDGIFAYRASNCVARGNSIFDNLELGIDIYGDGVTANRPANAVAFYYGANYPELTSAYTGGGSTTVAGTITTPHMPVNGERMKRVIDFYATPSVDESGHGEGQIYLGSCEVVPQGPTRINPFVATLPAEVPPGYVLTATASTLEVGYHGYAESSEFSRAIYPVPDADGDGVWDDMEDAGPNGGDANGDGTRDAWQSNVAALPNAIDGPVDGQYVVLEAGPGERLREVRALQNPSVENAPPGVTFPFGFFSFVASFTPVTFYLPGIDTAYNFGPTQDRPFDHWYRVPESELDTDSDRLVLHGLLANTLFGPAAILPGAGTTIVVNSTDDEDDRQPDNGMTTLREAINLANYLPGKDAIAFNIPGPGPHTIRPASGLPRITETVVIDGYTQPGAQPATDDQTAVIMIEVDGSLAGSSDGLYIVARTTTIRGLCINRFRSDDHAWGGNQIVIAGGGGSQIEGNYIGTDPTGTISYYESGHYDVQLRGIVSNSEDNNIGGTSPAARNVISGFAGEGIYVGRYDTYAVGAGTRIMGNYVGTDATGTAALTNDTGVWLDGCHDVVIGGTTPGAGNLISGNVDAGVNIWTWFRDYEEEYEGEPPWGSVVGRNLVQGNLIGTDVTGTHSVGNGVGIEIIEGISNLIGGTVPEARNVISGNLGDGIQIGFGEEPSMYNVIQGNFIGTDVNGQAALGNARDGVHIEWSQENTVGGTELGAANVIAFNGRHGVAVVSGDWEDTDAQQNAVLSNQIYLNGGLGIDLGGSGVTPNDPAETGVWRDPLVQVDFRAETPEGMPAVDVTLVVRRGPSTTSN